MRSRATRGTINRSTLLLLECKIIPGSHAKRLSSIASSSSLCVCAGVVSSELLGSGSSSLLRQDFPLLHAAAACASAVHAQVAAEAAYEARYVLTTAGVNAQHGQPRRLAEWCTV